MAFSRAWRRRSSQSSARLARAKGRPVGTRTGSDSRERSLHRTVLTAGSPRPECVCVCEHVQPLLGRSTQALLTASYLRKVRLPKVSTQHGSAHDETRSRRRLGEGGHGRGAFAHAFAEAVEGGHTVREPRAHAQLPRGRHGTSSSSAQPRLWRRAQRPRSEWLAQNGGSIARGSSEGSLVPWREWRRYCWLKTSPTTPS